MATSAFIFPKTFFLLLAADAAWAPLHVTFSPDHLLFGFQSNCVLCGPSPQVLSLGKGLILGCLEKGTAETP